MTNNIRLIVRYVETGFEEYIKAAVAALPSFAAQDGNSSDAPRTVPWLTIQQTIHNDDSWLAAVNPVTALYLRSTSQSSNDDDDDNDNYNDNNNDKTKQDDEPEDKLLPQNESIPLVNETTSSPPSCEMSVFVRVERATPLDRHLIVSTFTLSVDTDVQMKDSNNGSVRFYDRRRRGYRRLRKGVSVPSRRAGPLVRLLMEHRLPNPLPSSYSIESLSTQSPDVSPRNTGNNTVDDNLNNNNNNIDNNNNSAATTATTPTMIYDDFDDEETDSEANDNDNDDDNDDDDDNNADLSDWTVINNNASQRGLIGEHVQPIKVATLTEERGNGSGWQTAVLPQRRSEVDKRIKKMLRRGVPPQLRNFIWHALSGGMDVDLHTDTNLYHRNLTAVFQGSLEEARHIHPFLVPTFGVSDLSTLSRFLNPSGCAAARRILCVLAERNPDLDQCPILVPVTALFLVYLPEHTTYSSLYAMIQESRSSRWYFRINALQNASFAQSFAIMLKKRLGNLYRHFKNLGIEIHKIVRPWFDHFFVGLVPDSNIPFIMDAFVHEGAKILYRFAFAIFKSDERALLRMHDPDSVTNRLNDVVSTIKFRDLSQRAYSVRLRRDSIENWEYQTRTSMDMASLSVSNNLYYRPKIKDPSGIVPSMQHWEEIWSFIGARYRIRNLRRRFSASNDGYSLNTMLNALIDCSSSIMLIEGVPYNDFKVSKKDDTNLKHCIIMGAFVPQPYERKSGFYGHADTVVFRLTPTPTAFPAIPGDRFILRSHYDGISFGSGGDGAALSISSDLKFASSQSSATFGNTPLCEWTERVYILHVEVYEFY